MIRIAAVALVLSFIIGGLVIAINGTSEESRVKQRLALRPMLVHEADAAKPVEHSVEWKNVVNLDRHETPLAGPKLYSTETNLGADATEAILFAWYELPSGEKKVTPRSVQLTDQQGTSHNHKIGGASFFLSMTQRLQEGTPPEPPEGLSHFVAYTVLDETEKSRTIKLATSDGPISIVLKRAAFVCLPTHEWHHDEYFGVSDPSSTWIIYEIEPINHSGSASTLDQFGFNTLKLGSAKWVCLPSSIRELK